MPCCHPDRSLPFPEGRGAEWRDLLFSEPRHKVGAPTLRTLQEPALSVSKGRATVEILFCGFSCRVDSHFQAARGSEVCRNPPSQRARRTGTRLCGNAREIKSPGHPPSLTYGIGMDSRYRLMMRTGANHGLITARARPARNTATHFPESSLRSHTWPTNVDWVKD
jgi:hypothetical protein